MQCAAFIHQDRCAAHAYRHHYARLASPMQDNATYSQCATAAPPSNSIVSGISPVVPRDLPPASPSVVPAPPSAAPFPWWAVGVGIAIAVGALLLALLCWCGCCGTWASRLFRRRRYVEKESPEPREQELATAVPVPVPQPVAGEVALEDEAGPSGVLPEARDVAGDLPRPRPSRAPSTSSLPSGSGSFSAMPRHLAMRQQLQPNAMQGAALGQDGEDGSGRGNGPILSKTSSQRTLASGASSRFLPGGRGFQMQQARTSNDGSSISPDRSNRGTRDVSPRSTAASGLSSHDSRRLPKRVSWVEATAASRQPSPRMSPETAAHTSPDAAASATFANMALTAAAMATVEAHDAEVARAAGHDSEDEQDGGYGRLSPELEAARMTAASLPGANLDKEEEVEMARMSFKLPQPGNNQLDDMDHPMMRNMEQAAPSLSRSFSMKGQLAAAATGASLSRTLSSKGQLAPAAAAANLSRSFSSKGLLAASGPRLHAPISRGKSSGALLLNSGGAAGQGLTPGGEAPPPRTLGVSALASPRINRDAAARPESPWLHGPQEDAPPPLREVRSMTVRLDPEYLGEEALAKRVQTIVRVVKDAYSLPEPAAGPGALSRDGSMSGRGSPTGSPQSAAAKRLPSPGPSQAQLPDGPWMSGAVPATQQQVSEDGRSSGQRPQVSRARSISQLVHTPSRLGMQVAPQPAPPLLHDDSGTAASEPLPPPVVAPAVGRRASWIASLIEPRPVAVSGSGVPDASASAPTSPAASSPTGGFGERMLNGLLSMGTAKSGPLQVLHGRRGAGGGGSGGQWTTYSNPYADPDKSEEDDDEDSQVRNMQASASIRGRRASTTAVPQGDARSSPLKPVWRPRTESRGGNRVSVQPNLSRDSNDEGIILDGSQVFSAAGGVPLHGALHREFSQPSLRVVPHGNLRRNSTLANMSPNVAAAAAAGPSVVGLGSSPVLTPSRSRRGSSAWT